MDRHAADQRARRLHGTAKSSRRAAPCVVPRPPLPLWRWRLDTTGHSAIASFKLDQQKFFSRPFLQDQRYISSTSGCRSKSPSSREVLAGNLPLFDGPEITGYRSGCRAARDVRAWEVIVGGADADRRCTTLAAEGAGDIFRDCIDVCVASVRRASPDANPIRGPKTQLAKPACSATRRAAEQSKAGRSCSTTRQPVGRHRLQPLIVRGRRRIHEQDASAVDGSAARR